MAEHTPGPWVMDPHTSTVSTCITEAYDLVIQNMLLNDGTPEDFANCRLIAAAPDLLEALEVAYEVMNHLGDILNGMDAATPEEEAWATPRWEKVQAAIAKAKEAQP